MRDVGGHGRGKGVAFDIGVVCEHAAERVTDEDGVFGRRAGLVGHVRRVVDGRDGDGDDGIIRPGAVAHRVRERVGAEVVRIRRVHPAAVRLLGECAVGRVADRDHCEGIALDVHVVRQQVPALIGRSVSSSVETESSYAMGGGSTSSTMIRACVALVPPFPSDTV